MSFCSFALSSDIEQLFWWWTFCVWILVCVSRSSIKFSVHISIYYILLCLIENFKQTLNTSLTGQCVQKRLPQEWLVLGVCGRWWKLQMASHLGAWGSQLPEHRWGEMLWSNAHGNTEHNSPSLPSSSVSCSTHISTSRRETIAESHWKTQY